MRGTSNTGAGKATGDKFAAETANDLLKVAVGADDDALAELLDFEPPAGVTAESPRVGFLALRNGPIVTGDGAARNVTVAPVRVFRSSIDNAKPREMLSAVSLAPTVVALPAVVTGASNWRLELLYAQITYVDASKPEMGTQVTFQFAPTAAGTNPAPSVATLPANTSTIWNVPLAYVKNVTGQTTVATEDILDVPPSVVGGFAQDHQARIVAKKSGIEARRAYSSANHSPLTLVSGGSSALATAASLLTASITPPSVGRHGLELVIREIPIPKEISGFTNSVKTHVVVDDTRDWRGASFVSLWNVSSASGTFLAEDDTGNGSGTSRVIPGLDSGSLGPTINGNHLSFGNSWCTSPLTEIGDAGDYVAAELQSAQKTKTNEDGVNYYDGVTANIGLTVHPTTGVLRFSRKISGTALAGAAIYCVLFAFFPNKR